MGEERGDLEWADAESTEFAEKKNRSQRGGA